MNKLKLFGFQRATMNYNYYNPLKVKCWRENKNGYFEAPRYSKNRTLHHLVDQYKQRVEYEKYMNPRGIKPTITSNFPKIGDTLDFVNLKCILVRSGKDYNGNFIKFLVDKKMSKPEIVQYLQKLYEMKPKQVKTAILPGEVYAKTFGSKNRSKMQWLRKPDRKKALVELDFKFHSFYSKIQ